MNMKKIVLFLLFASALISCNRQSDLGIVAGSVDEAFLGKDNLKVILADEDVFASSDVVDGHFELSYKVSQRKTPFVITLQFDGAMNRDLAYTFTLVPEAGRTVVEIGPNTILEGGMDSKAMREVQSDMQEIYFSYGQRMMEAMDAEDDITLENLANERRDAMSETALKHYLNNLNGWAGIQALQTYIQSNLETMSYKQIKELIEKGGPLIQNYDGFQEYLDMKEGLTSGFGDGKVAGLEKGITYVDISGKGMDGKTVRLADFIGKDKYILLDFWASWCTPCRESIPMLRQIESEYPLVRIVGINCQENDIEDGLEAVKKEGLTWTQIFTEDQVTRAYQFNGIPSFVLLSPDGIVLESYEGLFNLIGLMDKYFSK